MKKITKTKPETIVFIGAGPATITAVLRLIDMDYNKNNKIIIIEKGKSSSTRSSKEVIYGWAGAGSFSDGKLSSSLDVGGNIPNLTEEELEKFENYFIDLVNSFNEYEPLKWDSLKEFDIKDSTLNWNSHKVCHMGTERTRSIYSNMETFILSQPNIEIIYEAEVIGVFNLIGVYEVVYRDKEKGAQYLIVDKAILATGQKNNLPSQVIDFHSLKSTPRAFQLGIRVEDQMNPQYEKIIEANYDFKFVKSYDYNGVKVRVRTFCCNSGNAHTCAEKAAEGFTCFNGHAFKTPDPNNHTVNYGIICEVEGLKDYQTKAQQIDLMKKVNSIDTWYADNFYNDDKIDEDCVMPKRKLLEGFPQLVGYYPEEVIKSLTDFVGKLNKLVDLSKARYLYPEVKLSGNIPELNYDTFETKESGLYMIGDCACTRGIIKSSLTGWKLAEGLLKNEH